jgi:hypothetical protein
MIDDVMNILRKGVNIFFNLMDHEHLARKKVATNPHVEAVLLKVNEYYDLNNMRLQVSDHEESLKQYNKLSLLFSLVLFFYILRLIFNFTCYIWSKISKIIF